MATQVKFHSVSTAQYNDATRPLGDGSLYFIDDNGEIRKGGKHVTGTRVFLAEDTASTCSPVEDLTIYIDGQAITEEGAEQPKRGDMLRVKHVLATKTVKVVDAEGNPVYEEDGETQKEETIETAVEYSAYVYGANGGAYDVSKWEACDGNVDASKVILTQNITMAGNYDKIGNLSKGSTSGKETAPLTDSDGNKVGTAGASVYELLKQMLSKTVEPKKNSDPSITLTVTNTSYNVEFGSTVTPTYKVTFSDGSYIYEGGTAQAAGCSATGYDVTNVVDGTKSTGNVNSITADSASKTLTVTAKATYSAGTNTPKNNLGDASTTCAKIAAGTTATKSSTVTVTSYRKTFYTTYLFDAKKSDADLMALTSADIRQFTGAKDKPTSWSHGQAAQFVIFVPASDSKKITEATTSKGLPYTFKKVQKDGADYKVTVEGANGSASVDYVIWVDEEGSNVAADTMSIKWA